MADETCDAVIAEFVFGPQFCREPAIKQFTHDGETFWACAEHDPEK